MKRPADTVIGAGFECCDSLLHVAAGDDCDDRNVGGLGAERAARVGDVGAGDDRHIGVESRK
jgi:hypothetical protein